MSRSPINVAIVGTGMSLSVFHRPSIIFLKDQFNLHTVVERSGKGRAREICGDGIKVASSLDDVVADQEVDLVVISTPNNTHFPFAKQALTAGKHVLIEKPMCITAAEGEELNQIALEKGVVLSVYQNRRWDADFLTVQKLLQSGKLGELVEFNSNYDRYRPLPGNHVAGATWKEQPGQHNDVIYNLGSHIIDQLYVLFGMPEKVGCRFTDVRKVGVDEGFLMDLYYAPGAGTGNSPFVATVQGSIMSCLPAQQRFLLKGTKGSYIKYGVDPQEKHLKVFGSRNDPQADWGVEEESAWGTLFEARKAEAGEEGVKNNDGTEFVTTKYPSVPGEYNALYANLYDVISSGDKSKLVVKPEQAIGVLRIIELGQRAAKEERLVYAKELK